MLSVPIEISGKWILCACVSTGKFDHLHVAFLRLYRANWRVLFVYLPIEKKSALCSIRRQRFFILYRKVFFWSANWFSETGR